MIRPGLLSCFAFVGCATAGLSDLGAVAPPRNEPALHLVDAATGPEVGALLARFYGPAPGALAELQKETERVLARYPDAAEAHEVAALLARLRGDDHAQVRHLLAAAADRKAAATELYLGEALDHVDTVSERDAAIALLDELARRHPRPSVRALSTRLLAGSVLTRGEIERTQALAATLGYLDRFFVLGALDNDQGKGFLARYAPERDLRKPIDLAEEVPGVVVPVRWRKVPRLTPFGEVPLSDLMTPGEHAVAYLVAWVHSDAGRDAELHLGTGSPIRVFWNDALLASEERTSGAITESLVVPVPLRAGWNQLLIKSAHKRGPWRLSARLAAPDGTPLTGLKLADAPPPYEHASGEALGRARYHDLPAPSTGGPDPLGPPPRRLVLAGLALERAGQAELALAPLRELVDRAPGNLLAVHLAAGAYWANGELGRTIDLLDRAIQAQPDESLSLLAMRGGYYRQKNLYDKAIADWKLVAQKQPAARRTRSRLAELYEARGWNVDRRGLLVEILRAWPDDAGALVSLAHAEEALGYHAAGERWLRRALAIEPGNPYAMRGLHNAALARRDPGAALGWVRATLRIQPTNVDLLLQAAEDERRAGHPAEAARLDEQVLALDPDGAPAFRHLGQLAYEAGDTARAVQRWRQALERNPNDSSLAQHVAFLSPARLGALGKYVPSEAEIDAALLGAKSIVAHPGSHTILVLDHEVTEVNADGSARRVVTNVARVVTEQGRDALTQERVPQGKLEILRAFSLTPSGERQEASSIREGMIRFRKLELGSIVVTQYVHYARPEHFLPSHFVAEWFFQNVDAQIERSTWILLAPKERFLRVKLHGEVTQKDSTDGNLRVRTFSASGVPPLVEEPQMPPAHDLLRRVSVTTIESWDEYVRWERALLTDALRGSPRLAELARSLTDGAKTPAEKLDRLLHHVAKEIRYQQDYETTIAGVQPHAAPVVLERGYGDCKDKAVLLILLAREIGLKLHFAILRTMGAGEVERDIPNQQFNHAIVYVPEQPGLSARFLDPTTDGLDIGNLRQDDQGATSLVLDPDTGAWRFVEIPYQPAELDGQKHELRITVRSPTEAGCEHRIVARGEMAMGLRRVARSAEQAKRVFQSFSSLFFPGSTLDRWELKGKEDLWHPVEVSLGLNVGNSIQAEGARYRLKLPSLFPAEHAAALATRQTPLVLGARDYVTLEMDVELPPGYRSVSAPAEFTVAHPCFEARRRTHIDGARIHVRFDYRRSCARVEVVDYPAFRTAVQQVVRQAQDAVVFEKGPPLRRR